MTHELARLDIDFRRPRLAVRRRRLGRQDGRIPLRDGKLQELAQSAIFAVALGYEFVGRHGRERCELRGDVFGDPCRSDGERVARFICVFVNDFIHDAELLQLVRINRLRRRELVAVFGELGGFVRVVLVSPQNRSGPFWRDDAVVRLRQHAHGIAHGQAQRAAGPALAEDDGDDGRAEPRHGRQIRRNRLTLARVLRRERRPRAARVHERDDW
mmetsp:Transcript_25801/g.86707  ORF Transcript_25801/g.86707 Transcript_25801/m.86707 type:complete len:214 (+) Transcript_25801:2216-2857(+)